MKKRAIGLELTDHAIVLCQIARENGSVTVKRQEMISLPSGVITMGEIKDSVTLARTISSVLPNPFVAPIPIMVSMTGFQAFIRKFSIPFVPEQEIAQVVRWEGENILPYPIIEVFYHYQVLGRTDDHYRILFAAHRRERVDPYINLFHDLDMPIRLLTIHPFGLANYLESTGQLQGFSGIMARFRSSEFELALFFEGEIELVRTVAMSQECDLQAVTDCFYEEISSTLEHFHTERGIWLNSGIFFGSMQMMHSIREKISSFHWRHFYPQAKRIDGMYGREHCDGLAAPSYLDRSVSRFNDEPRDDLRGLGDEEEKTKISPNLHQELPCAFGLAMLGVEG